MCFLWNFGIQWVCVTTYVCFFYKPSSAVKLALILRIRSAGIKRAAALFITFRNILNSALYHTSLLIYLSEFLLCEVGKTTLLKLSDGIEVTDRPSEMIIGWWKELSATSVYHSTQCKCVEFAMVISGDDCVADFNLLVYLYWKPQNRSCLIVQQCPRLLNRHLEQSSIIGSVLIAAYWKYVYYVYNNYFCFTWFYCICKLLKMSITLRWFRQVIVAIWYWFMYYECQLTLFLVFVLFLMMVFSPTPVSVDFLVSLLSWIASIEIYL